MKKYLYAKHLIFCVDKKLRLLSDATILQMIITHKYKSSLFKKWIYKYNSWPNDSELIKEISLSENCFLL